MRHRPAAFAATVLAAAALLGACGDDDDEPAAVTCVAGDGGDGEVAIAGFTFEPGELEVDAGTTVTFRNEDPADHSVWSDERVDGEPAFESVGADPSAPRPEVLHEGDASTCTFPAPGRYEYLCGVHNSMRGTITVG